jgi:hypothetical protein
MDFRMHGATIKIHILHILPTAIRTGFERSAGRRQISAARSDFGVLGVGFTSSPNKISIALKPGNWLLMARKRGERP